MDAVCPRCGTPREPDQAYCLDCGLPLPALQGAVPALRRRWVSRLGWYPGDWIWSALLALVVAILGALAAILLTTTKGDANAGTTFAATSLSVPLTNPSTTVAVTVGTGPLPTAPEPTVTVRSPPKPPNGKTPWPAGKNGWTVVLLSLPAKGGAGAAADKARRAASSGLPEAGVIVSSQFSSLHPGYLVVFSGIYDTKAEADAAARTAHSKGFSGAYSRPVAR